MPVEKNALANLSETPAAATDLGNMFARDEQTVGYGDLRQQIEHALTASEHTTLIELAGAHQLLIGRNGDGVRLELFQEGDTEPLWSKQYSRKKCAIKGALRALDQCGVVAQDTSSDASASAADSISADHPEAVAYGQGPGSIWAKVPTRFKYVTTITGNGTEVTINVVPSGPDSSLVEMTWEGRRLVREYDNDWSAKSEALKMANRLIEWAS